MPPTPAQILICDDDKTFHHNLKAALKGKYECRSAYDSTEGLAIAKNYHLDLIILDIQMKTPDEGLRAIPFFRELDSDVAIIVSSGLTDYQIVREAMKLGAADYLVKGSDLEAIQITLSQALEKRAILKHSARQNFEAAHFQSRNILIGGSPLVDRLRKTIERVRQSSANVLITGETGAGKEVVARLLRRSLPDGSLAPFVAIDSSTIQANMAESILFGHEKGSFTGADRTTKGLFEQADGGIIYFDEIGNMPLEIQAKLLRVVQEREIARLGSTRAISSQFRVVCATNKDLEQMARNGLFKDDLLQRLNVLPIQLPPLRERTEDIPLLIDHFLKVQTQEGESVTFTEAAIAALKGYSWPGNVRELGNIVSYVTAMTDGLEIDLEDLPPKLRDSARVQQTATIPTSAAGGPKSFYEQVSAFEQELLRREYEKHEGNISKLALALGMDRSHLYTKLKEAGLYSTKKR